MNASKMLLLVASAAFFIAGSASAQNSGTVSNHAIAVGKGPGMSGFSSVACADKLFLAGRSGLDPACRAIIGADLPFPGASSLGGAFSLAAASNQFLTGLGTDGNFTRAQPSFANISGSWSCAQAPAFTGNVTTPAGSCVTTIAALAVTNGMLAGSIAASKLVGTDIATVGTITTGTWNANKIALAYGGTNADLSGTGGTSQFLRQNTAGGPIAPVRPACADLSNASASCSTDATNASNIASGTLNTARLPSPFTNGTASGNTSKFATVAGTPSGGNCAQFDANGNVADAGAACGTGGGGGGRPLLTANRTYYVRTDGHDTNCNGLANASAASSPNCAFLTIQKAIDVTASIDLASYNVTISLADGTYTSGLSVIAPWVGTGTVTVVGNNATPGNVIISTTSSNAVSVLGPGSRLSIQDLEVRTTTSGHAFTADSFGKISFQNIRFGATAQQHIRAVNFAYIVATGNYSIVGGAQVHAVGSGGAGVNISSRTITLTGTPAFSAWFALAEINGFVLVYSSTFSGSATGSRYFATINGAIHSNGAGTSFLPGSTAGSTANQGLYI